MCVSPVTRDTGTVNRCRRERERGRERAKQRGKLAAKRIAREHFVPTDNRVSEERRERRDETRREDKKKLMMMQSLASFDRSIRCPRTQGPESRHPATHSLTHTVAASL